MAFTGLIADRNAGLVALDMDWAREMMPNMSDDVRLIAMHKTRYEIRTIPDDERHASRSWLEERDLSRLGFLPWPPLGVLP